MSFWNRLFGKKKPAQNHQEPPPTARNESDLDREVSALYSVLVEVMGSDRLVIQAGKMDALRYMRSANPGDRVLALRRILEENPTLEPPPKPSEIPAELTRLSEVIADIVARRNVEDKIDRKINEKLEKEHQEYIKDIKMQVLREEKADVETPHDAQKRHELEAMEQVKLTQSVMELLRPKTLDEIIGQERAVKSLRAKFPKHVTGVDDNILNPENSWADKDAFRKNANELAAAFVKNFENFSDTEQGKNLVKFGPEL